jgi:hypothetical protein
MKTVGEKLEEGSLGNYLLDGCPRHDALRDNPAPVPFAPNQAALGSEREGGRETWSS